MQDYEKAVLFAALADIDALAAPRNIDSVCRVLGIDVRDFAQLGSAGMKAKLKAVLGQAEGDSGADERVRANRHMPVNG